MRIFGAYRFHLSTGGPTTYGFEISKKFAKELAQQGVQIVSGLARGVDGTVHREIIDKKGQAVGVLGCGM